MAIRKLKCSLDAADFVRHIPYPPLALTVENSTANTGVPMAYGVMDLAAGKFRVSRQSGGRMG